MGPFLVLNIVYTQTSCRHFCHPNLEKNEHTFGGYKIKLQSIEYMRGSKGRDRESGPLPLKNPKAIGFLSNTGLDPLENHKATKPVFNVRPSSASQQNAIIEPRHEISTNVVYATNKASDQPALTHSLIRPFASRLNIL